MNITHFIEDFKDADWNYLFVNGSRLGNTSFLARFMKMVLIGEEAFEDKKINRLLDEQAKILYLRSQEPNVADKKILKELSSVALIEYISSEDIFNYREVLRYLHNRRYTYLIIDEVRQKYSDKRFEKFNEIISYAESQGIKLITSVTEDRQQKLDYCHSQADIVFEVDTLLSMGVYEIIVEDVKNYKTKTYTLTMET